MLIHIFTKPFLFWYSTLPFVILNFIHITTTRAYNQPVSSFKLMHVSEYKLVYYI